MHSLARKWSILISSLYWGLLTQSSSQAADQGVMTTEMLTYAIDHRFDPGNPHPPHYVLPDGQNQLDLVYDSSPGAAKRPLVIFVHGGGWHSGDKNGYASTLGAYFYRNGFAFAAINYRLLYLNYNEAKQPIGVMDNPVASIPNDLAKAISFLAKIADSKNIDNNRIALMGHSAGAHLAALALANPAYLNRVGISQHAVRALVLLDGNVYDLNLVLKDGTDFLDLRPIFKAEVGNFQTTASRMASPAYFVENPPTGSASFPAALVLFGKDGSSIHPSPQASGAQGMALALALQNRGFDASTLEIDISHTQFVLDLTDPTKVVNQSVFAFLKSHL